MVKYVMDDSFEFVTDISKRVVASRKTVSGNYQKEELPIYVNGSPCIGKQLSFKARDVQGEPSWTTPARVSYIDPDFVLEE